MLDLKYPLQATIEECAALRYRVMRLKHISWLPRISMVSVLACLCFYLMSWTAAAQDTNEHRQAIGPQLTFQTLDGDTQQVNPDEIWRIRATSTSDEPPGATVIDYAFDRVYVKESLASVVEKVGRVRPLKKFTLPAGAPVYIVAAKVTGVTRAIPARDHPNAHAIIVAREGLTQVRETREAVSETLME
jgi:hypothetical protein